MCDCRIFRLYSRRRDEMRAQILRTADCGDDCSGSDALGAADASVCFNCITLYFRWKNTSKGKVLYNVGGKQVMPPSSIRISTSDQQQPEEADELAPHVE